jgi:hypothetical protein
MRAYRSLITIAREPAGEDGAHSEGSSSAVYQDGRDVCSEQVAYIIEPVIPAAMLNSP